MKTQVTKNQVTTVKIGGGFVNIVNAGKSDREIIAQATIMKAVGESSGLADSKAKIVNGDFKLKEHVVYAYEVFPALAAGDNSDLNFLKEEKKFERGKYSLIEGTQLKKFQNVSVHGIRISVADAPGGVVGRFKTDIDTADDLAGLMDSHLVVKHNGVEDLDIPISRLVTKTYNKEGFASLDKNVVLLEQAPLQIQIKPAANGAFRADIAIKVELIGFTTYAIN